MPRFRLKADDKVDLYHPGSHSASLRVEPDQVVDAPGTLVTSRTAEKGKPVPPPLPTDAYVVALDGEERLWPHAVWELVQDRAAKPADGKES